MAKKKSSKTPEEPLEIDIEMEVDEPEIDPMEIMQCPKCFSTIFVLNTKNRAGVLYCESCAEKIPMSEIQNYIYSYKNRNVTLLYDGFMEHFDQIIGSISFQSMSDVSLKERFDPKVEHLVSKIKEVVDVIAEICGVKKVN